jgi:cobalamin biosynthesis Mg chelatase CobN
MVSNMYEVPDEQITVTVTEATERGARRLTATNWNVDYQVQTNQFEVDAIMEIAHEMDSDIAKLTEAIRETFAQRGLQVDAATVESEPPSSMQVTATRTTMTSVTTATMTGNSPQTASTGTSNEAETDEASGNTALFAIIGVVAAVLMLTVGIVVMKKRRRDNVNTADDPASNFRPPDTNYEDGPRLSSV